MKLPKPPGCLLPDGRGNLKKQTTLVEGRGIGFRTRVRLPSGPLEKKRETEVISLSFFRAKIKTGVERRGFPRSGKESSGGAFEPKGGLKEEILRISFEFTAPSVAQTDCTTATQLRASRLVYCAMGVERRPEGRNTSYFF